MSTTYNLADHVSCDTTLESSCPIAGLLSTRIWKILRYSIERDILNCHDFLPYTNEAIHQLSLAIHVLGFVDSFSAAEEGHSHFLLWTN
jgi:hypothetical protein